MFPYLQHNSFSGSEPFNLCFKYCTIKKNKIFIKHTPTHTQWKDFCRVRCETVSRPYEKHGFE